MSRRFTAPLDNEMNPEPYDSIQQQEQEQQEQEPTAPTTDQQLAELLQMVSALTTNQQKLASELDRISKGPLSNLSTTTTTAPVTIPTAPIPVSQPVRPLPEFRLPSVKPPAFNGDIRNKPAYESQLIIDNYLHETEMMAELYNLLHDDAVPTFSHQPNYVTWACIGLTGHAQTQWRRMDPIERPKTWREYKTWIQKTFSSNLTLDQAIDSIHTLEQKGSAISYTQRFNELVAAMTTTDIKHPDEYLCRLYRRGLKTQLRTSVDLSRINSSLKDLQDETEKLDDFYWKIGRKRSTVSYPTAAPRTNTATPMEIDNINTAPRTPFRKLSDEEKRQFRANGWCTFCRGKDHVYAACKDPGKKFGPKINSISTSTAIDEEYQHDEDESNGSNLLQ
jgi:hypothetical protein